MKFSSLGCKFRIKFEIEKFWVHVCYYTRWKCINFSTKKSQGIRWSVCTVQHCALVANKFVILILIHTFIFWLQTQIHFLARRLRKKKTTKSLNKPTLPSGYRDQNTSWQGDWKTKQPCLSSSTI
jgi:hypothetical protein